MDKLYQQKHELWLQILFGAFALPKGEIFDVLYDFSLIEFRHLKWLAKEIVKMAKIECNIEPIETKDYPTPAKRPHYSLLNKSKIKTKFKK